MTAWGLSNAWVVSWALSSTLKRGLPGGVVSEGDGIVHLRRAFDQGQEA